MTIMVSPSGQVVNCEEPLLGRLLDQGWRVKALPVPVIDQEAEAEAEAEPKLRRKR